MLVVFLPGFLRLASLFAPWNSRLPADVWALNLPGQAGTRPLADQTISGLVEHFVPLIPTEALVVGESLGGLIALGLAAHGYRVAAFDPPLFPARCEALQASIRHDVAQRPERTWLPEFVANIFGAMPDGAIEARSYWSLLDASAGPYPIFGASNGSVLHTEDEERLHAHPSVRFKRLAGPHSLLTSCIEDCRVELLKLLEQPGLH